MRNMQTITIELKDNKSLKAIKELENRDLIRIVKEPLVQSYALPGEPMTDMEFEDWVKSAEDSESIDFSEYETKWQKKRENLQKLIR